MPRLSHLSVVCALLLSCARSPQAESPTEYEVKAAYLYNFALFTEWPAQTPPRGIFSVCITGENHLGPKLKRLLAGKTVQGKQVIIRHVEESESARTCDVLFIGAGESARLQGILKKLYHAPVLTVSDMPSFIARGGMIGFSVGNQHVRFSVNNTQAEKAGLKLSSQLLKVAKRVTGASATEVP